MKIYPQKMMSHIASDGKLFSNAGSSTVWEVSKCGVISGPYFPLLGLNTGKYRPEMTPYMDTFHAMLKIQSIWLDSGICFGNIENDVSILQVAKMRIFGLFRFSKTWWVDPLELFFFKLFEKGKKALILSLW